MNCEEFECIALDAYPGESAPGSVDGERLAAAMEHANSCRQCAALLHSWHTAKEALQFWRAATQNAETPARVEFRLRQALCDQQSLRRRKLAMFSAWTLATAAAVLMGALSWRGWHDQRNSTKKVPAPVVSTPPQPEIAADEKPNHQGEEGTGQRQPVFWRAGRHTYAGDDLNGFTFLPGSVPMENGDSEILRVRLQRGALGALGLPVNEERAGEWLQVDLLVTEDGQPQAVRLAR